MRRPFPTRTALILAAACALAAAPAAAQSWGHNSGQGYHRGGSDWAPSAFDWRSQVDRPGDYRCDAFWDANRTDCGARWRDQRHRVSRQARSDYRALAGYARNDGRYGRAYDSGHGDRYQTRRRGYGHGYGHGYGQDRGPATAYHGAYGRPDLVYSSGGYGGYGGPAYGGGRDPGRVDWCRATYRSYDARSGYYRAWSGRLIFCG
ncbi:MAG: BA14K family protein [Brevundimonas sp.]|uniref:BA14K family protein n=1 Tax=Brevundimonas sp. TaxID=1871086 RepID=UPI002617FB93|nr:BA14K family protein [Brevundimonas sp.]MDI6624129.1 BA14K family protein [Brevundimonas sp.]MDQ7811560.1 BA14K family protein [Brevundimonas sp.]